MTISNVAPYKRQFETESKKTGGTMKDKRGPYYSSGNCIIKDTPCEYFSEGACGICPIGGARSRYLRQQAEALVKEPLPELCEAKI